MSDSPHEIEPALVTSRPIMWGADERHGEIPRAALEAQHAALADELQHRHRGDLEQLLVVLASSLRTRRHLVPIYVNGAGGVGATVQRELPNFPDQGQWVLESIVCWADPAASAPLATNLVLDQALPVPIPLALSKTAPTATLLGGLPVSQQDTIRADTSGGAAGDRGVVLLIFKREG